MEQFPIASRACKHMDLMVALLQSVFTGLATLSSRVTSVPRRGLILAGNFR
jgi:hypothetical protein